MSEGSSSPHHSPNLLLSVFFILPTHTEWVLWVFNLISMMPNYVTYFFIHLIMSVCILELRQGLECREFTWKVISEQK
jgi:hypothetical protein